MDIFVAKHLMKPEFLLCDQFLDPLLDTFWSQLSQQLGSAFPIDRLSTAWQNHACLLACIGGE